MSFGTTTLHPRKPRFSTSTKITHKFYEHDD